MNFNIPGLMANLELRLSDSLQVSDSLLSKKDPSYWDYYFKSMKWYIGNLIFGAAPLLLMVTVMLLSSNKTGYDEAKHLVYEGVLHFLCVAIMGAVVTEHLISGFYYKGLLAFAIYIFPILILSFVSLEYLLVYLKTIKNLCFGLNSTNSIIVFSLSYIYCTFIKAKFYIKEEETR